MNEKKKNNSTYRRKTPATKNVTNMPVELSAIAPMAHADSGRKNTSGILWHSCLLRSGNVPFGHVLHCVSSSGLLI